MAITNSSASTPTRRFPTICPASPCPATYPSQFSGGAGRHAGPGGLVLHQGRNAEGQSHAGQHLDLVFGRRQQLQRAAGRFQPPLQPRSVAARRLHLVEGAGRWRFVERHNRRQCARPGVESVRHPRRLGAGHLRCDECRRDQRGLRPALRQGQAYANGMQRLCQRPGQRLVGEQHRHPAKRIPVHAAAQLQPVEQWRHAQSRAAVRQSQFHRQPDSGHAGAVVQSRLRFCNRQPTADSTAMLARDNLTGPGLATWDFSAIKNTRCASA